jgi:ribosome-binding ATPase
MRLPIIGLPQSGRTTLWHALSGGHSSGKDNVSTIKIPDQRLMDIAQVCQAKKITPIEFELQDTIGDISKGGAIFSDLQGADGLIVCIRAFDGGFGKFEPARDAKRILESLVLFDSAALESRIANIHKDSGKGKTIDDRRHLEAEINSLLHFQKTLESEQPLRLLEKNEMESKLAKNQGLLTAKDWIVILSSEEPIDTETLNLVSQTLHSPVIWLATKLETEIEELSEEECTVFREELCIPAGMIDKTLLAIKDAMNIIQFYTGNEKEARSWAILRGTIAQDAAGKIHTDIARGFIRAEIVSWDKFIEAGGYAQARAKAYFRVEGKEYPMQDGDYVSFRFNI